MHRIDGPGATTEGQFTEGDPSIGLPATIVTADWLNSLQEEVANVIEETGDALDKLDNTQLLAAIQAIVADAIPEVPEAFTTGDVRLTYSNTASPGWVMLDDGTIGDTGSGATTLADPSAQPLYTLLWSIVPDTWAPVAGGRGASAPDDWAAGKTLTLPRALGRALAVAGAGTGLTPRDLGESLGEEDHTLTRAELPAQGLTMSLPRKYGSNEGSGTGFSKDNGTTSNGTGTTENMGSGQAHNNMPPTSFLNAMIKL